MKREYNLIFLGFGILTILVFSALALIPREAGAYEARVDGCGTSQWPTYTNSASSTIPANNPRPSISSINPNSANLGEGAKTVTILGSGFVSNSVARVDGTDRPTTFIDYSHLLVHLNANDMVGANGRYITVSNPTPGGGSSNAEFFTINDYVAPGASATNGNQNGGATYNNGNSYGAEGQVQREETVSNLASNVVFGTTSFMPSGIVQWIFFAILILLIVILVRKIFKGEEKYQATPLKHA
ncbi:MAG: IPT/TIG domain-containing protein [Candidatus Paceibacterota bacterium]